MCQHEYSGFGLQFLYPDDWELSEEVDDEQASITVSSPETAFWSATVIRNRPDPHSVLRAALRAFEEEYEELDIEEAEEAIGDHQSAAAEVNFVCLELTNTAILRVAAMPHFTLLVLYQFQDAEQESSLQQISDSLVIAAE